MRWAALPLLLLAAVPAYAVDHPSLLPTRDVTVVYQLAGDASDAVPGGGVGTLRIAWSAAGRRLRVEPEGRSQVLLLDLGAHLLRVVDSSIKTAMTLPVRQKDLNPLTLEGATLTPGAQDSVAGLACTDYAVSSPRGHGTVCLTPDSVPLRATGEFDGRQGSFTATTVKYGPVPARMLDVPRGYTDLDFLGLGRAK